MSNQLLEEEQKQFVDVADITEVPGGKMKHLLPINCDMRTISSVHSEHKDILPK
jgi:hypothetical protein